MTPGQASEAGKVLIIDHPEGGKRVTPHVFDLPGGGIAYMDDGWTDPLNGTHDAHLVEATFTPFSRGWAATRDDGQDVFIEEYPDSPAQEGSREQARIDLEREFGITLI